MKSNISLKDLQQLIGNQKFFQKEPPVTTRATFKLRDLRDLIKDIEKNIGITTNQYDQYIDKNGAPIVEDYTHHICVTFVRQKVQDSLLNYYQAQYPGHENLAEYTVTDGTNDFTRVIPVITGCVAELDPGNKYTYLSFHYVDDGSGNIPFVRPGGEGSGLIPPPPPTGADDGQ